MIEKKKIEQIKDKKKLINPNVLIVYYQILKTFHAYFLKKNAFYHVLKIQNEYRN